jgi:hypothetical protein
MRGTIAERQDGGCARHAEGCQRKARYPENAGHRFGSRSTQEIARSHCNAAGYRSSDAACHLAQIFTKDHLPLAFVFGDI